MNIARFAIFTFDCFVVTGNCVAGIQGAGANAECVFSSVRLKVNMPRLEAERRISAAIGETNNYSPYANNLSGGTAKYESQNCTLTVTYAAGAPAPMVRTQENVIEHMAPRDETVLKFELVGKDPSLSTVPVKPRA
jgi:hypothetical protein